ncbi:MAG: FecR family protein [Sphingobacterium sp.]|uniref:FecR family protein n=1 Tax=unclassified Sphingobacterium TaxID=2609468 RepID=UPI00284002C8|nr:FecR family protein [Sphingobacterium sp.]MDR3007114.1 FecR family protein [Sphingobacterium sp.]
MNQENFNELFEKYLKGNCTPEELELFFQFVRDKKNESLLLDLMQQHELDADLHSEVFRQQMQLAFDKTDEMLAKELSQYPPKTKTVYLKWIPYAAAGILLVGAAFFGWQRWQEQSLQENGPKLVNTTIDHQAQMTLPNGKVLLLASDIKTPQVLLEKDQVQLVQKSANQLEIRGLGRGQIVHELLELKVFKGKRMQISFADHSSVMLNSTSRFKFSMEFDAHERKTELVGEGYFEVAHNPQKPFFVKTPTQLVQVYGTKFNIREYPDENLVSTALFEGKVSVRKRHGDSYGKADFLTPGKKIVLAKDRPVNEKVEIKNDKEIRGWITGRRYYNGVALKTILRDLSHDFDILIDGDKIPDLRFQGTIPQDFALDQIIELINQTANIKLYKKDNLITIQ